MTTFSFTLQIIGRLGDEADMDAVYASCPDSSLLVGGDATLLHFDREADSLHEAIRSAVGDVNTAGHHVDSVEIQPEALTTQTA